MIYINLELEMYYECLTLTLSRCLPLFEGVVIISQTCRINDV